MALTQESILSFLLDRGGKVKNSDLVNHFRSLIHSRDPAEQQRNRELFKTLVNSVAVVRTLDRTTFVVVKKRYQDFVVRDESGLRLSSPPPPPPGTDGTRRCENNKWPSNNKNFCPQESVKSVREDPDTTLKVLNISGDRAKRKSGPVFALIAVKTPPRFSDGSGPEMLPSRSTLNAIVDFKAPNSSFNCPSEEKPLINAIVDFKAPNSSFNCPSEEKPLINAIVDFKAPNSSFNCPPEDKPLIKTSTSPGEDVSPDSVPLEPQTHEWLVKCASGLWGQIHALLQQDPRLAHKRDFMSGFTALHWAAKYGNGQMIQRLAEVSKKSGVDSRAHGGYTPLHIAAIHGHSQAILLLVRRYGANVDVRDNDGKKACHYLRKGASAEVRALLGGLVAGKKTEEEGCREQHRGFNTISKLFQPHTSRKHKYSSRFAHDW